MRGTVTPNVSLHLPILIYIILALLLGSTIFGLWLINRRREARRTRKRYVFDGIIGMAEQPPPEPHALCLSWLCFQPERGACTRP